MRVAARVARAHSHGVPPAPRLVADAPLEDVSVLRHDIVLTCELQDGLELPDGDVVSRVTPRPGASVEAEGVAVHVHDAADAPVHEGLALVVEELWVRRPEERDEVPHELPRRAALISEIKKKNQKKIIFFSCHLTFGIGIFLELRAELREENPKTSPENLINTFCGAP